MDATDDKLDGGVLQPSKICRLSILSITFWALIFYVYHYSTEDNIVSVLSKPSVTSASLPLVSSSLTTITTGNGPYAESQLPQSEQSPMLADQYEASRTPPATAHENRNSPALSDRCGGRYIYMYDLPPRFNDDIVRDCGKLRPWSDMCPFMANGGMGQALGGEGGVFSERGWYATDQFMLDVLFRGRMKRYDCLTDDSSIAAAVYVPFYGSLDCGRFLFNYSTSVRDALSGDLIDWLVHRPEWRRMGGGDHFFAAGRTAWDFKRLADADELWGNKLLTYPAIKNMTIFVLETDPVNTSNIAIPYPTYFHPEAAADVLAWQEKVRGMERRWLFSFAGAPRAGGKTVRAEIIQQCAASSLCKLYHCGGGDGEADCDSPSGVMRVFESSQFCLQPRGDTATRRSTFDTILAACIPVFFHPDSAYSQYTLHFPSDHKKYSVLIMHTDVTGRNVSIEETLRKIPPEEVKRMREEVIGLIPRVVYADPRSRSVDFRDAFDVAVEAVIDRVAKRRRGEADEPQH